VKRWERRLEVLSNPDGLIIHCTLFITNTKVFYVSGVRGAMKDILADFLPKFVVKFEGAWQKSGFLFPHAHVLLPVLPEVRLFLEAMKELGAEVVSLEYQDEALPDPFTLFPDQESEAHVPDISALETFVEFGGSTISTLKSSPDLAHYLAKTTYRGGLRPLMKHKVK
jgi:hypothetical protein